MCFPCATGNYATQPGAINCKACAPGTFTNWLYDGTPYNLWPLSQLANCKQCMAGEYQPDEGTNFCLACPPGTNSSAGSDVCFPCPVGMTSPGNSSVCVNCPIGFFADFEVGLRLGLKHGCCFGAWRSQSPVGAGTESMWHWRSWSNFRFSFQTRAGVTLLQGVPQRLVPAHTRQGRVPALPGRRVQLQSPGLLHQVPTRTHHAQARHSQMLTMQGGDVCQLGSGCKRMQAVPSRLLLTRW